MGHTKAAGLIYGPDFHHLDHLGPLCAILERPLIVTEEDLKAQAEQFYPDLQVLYFDYLNFGINAISSYDLIVSCLPRALIDEIFLFAQQMQHKRIGSIWCPHGHSDKGSKIPYFEALISEKVIFVYGQKMLDMLKEKKVLPQLTAAIEIGNYRYLYFHKHHAFYLKKVEKIFHRFKNQQRTILYAPTWLDAEGSSSFFSACPALIETLPSHWNLLIKLHPNMQRTHSLKTDQMISTYEHIPNVAFLNDFPPIYPLLEKVDVYLGDMSSIGYDFLIFDKPMFFLLNSRVDSSHPLFQCGITIYPDQYRQAFEKIEKSIPHDKRDFSKKRNELYRYTFDEIKNFNELKNRFNLASDLAIEEGLMFP